MGEILSGLDPFHTRYSVRFVELYSLSSCSHDRVTFFSAVVVNNVVSSCQGL